MRRIFAPLFAVLYLASAIAAQAGFLINPYIYGGAAAPPAATITFLQCSAGVSLGGTNTATFTSQNVGTASADRYNIIGVMSDDSASVFNVTGVTVGGGAATEVADEGGTGATNAALYIFLNTAGTSENVVITMSETSNDDAVVCLWQANNLLSATAVSTATGNDTASASFNMNLSSTTSDGIAVGVCSSEDSTVRAVTWTGLTERAEADGGVLQISAADTSPTNGSSLTITCDWAGTSDAAGVTAAFR